VCLTDAPPKRTLHVGLIRRTNAFYQVPTLIDLYLGTGAAGAVFRDTGDSLDLDQDAGLSTGASHRRVPSTATEMPVTLLESRNMAC